MAPGIALDAGQQHAVGVPEFVLKILVGMPRPVAQCLGPGSLAFEASFRARRMGICCVCRGNPDPTPVFVLGRPFSGFGLAIFGWPTIKPPGITPLAVLAEIALADTTAVAIKALVAATCAERVMFVFDRSWELHPAMRIATAVTAGKNNLRKIDVLVI
jgi:hypothetical protein